MTPDMTDPAERARLLSNWNEWSFCAAKAALDLIERQQETIADAQQAAFEYGFRRDCDDGDPEAVAEADHLPSLVTWIASAEGDARSCRDAALALVERQQETIARLEAIIKAMQEAQAGDVTTIDDILEAKERNSDAE